MRSSRLRRGGAAAALLTGALVLSACAGGGGDEETIWVRALNSDPMTVTMNAQLTTGTYPTLFSAQLMDPLIFLSPDDGSLSPGLAEDWELSDDGLELTLDIRGGVTWHDGEPFTVEDVVFNFEEIVPLQVYGAVMAPRMESVEAVDDDTVVITMAEPFGPLLETVATQYMLPKHIYEGTDYLLNEANKAPIGTGPMMYSGYEPGESVTLVANPDYWGPVSQVDRAVYAVMADPNSRTEALFAGEVDQAIVEPSQQARVAESPDVELIDHGDYPQMVTLVFNARTPALQSVAARQAVFAALDREAMAETAMSGVGQATTGFFHPALDWAVDPGIDLLEDFPRDTDAIEAALDAAGFPRGADGTRFTLRLLYIQTLTEVVAAVEMAQSMLRDVGIESELIPVGGAAFSEAVYGTTEYDLAWSRASIGPDPSLGIATRYTCAPELTPGYNPSGVCDPELEAAAQQALVATDREERAAAFHVMQQRAKEIMVFAPVAWFDGAFPTIYTGRWDGQDGPRDIAERMPWSTMSLKG